MLKLYFYTINESELEAGRERALGMLPSWRVEKVEHMRPPKAKMLELAAGLLLRYGVLELTGKELRELEVAFGEQKKPYFPGGLQFNLSHSGDYVALAMADHPVGIDVEVKQDPGHGVAEHVFSTKELEYMRGEADPKRAFTWLWTRKEAYVKCTGTGITVPLNSFSVLETAVGEHLIHTVMQDGDYCLSLCVPGSAEGDREEQKKGNFPQFSLDIVEHFGV